MGISSGHVLVVVTSYGFAGSGLLLAAVIQEFHDRGDHRGAAAFFPADVQGLPAEAAAVTVPTLILTAEATPATANTFAELMPSGTVQAMRS